MNIKNETFPAPKDLLPYIESLWVTTVDGPANEISPVQCCLPNGTWELIFTITPQRFSILIDQEPVWMPESAGFATNGKPVYWQVEGGTVMIGVVLMPETMELLVNRPTLLRDYRFEDLRQYEQPIFDTLLYRARQASSIEKIVEVVFSTFREHLCQLQTVPVPSYFAEALRLIRKNNFISPSIDDLSEQVYVSKRKLQRTFQEKLGYGPKAYSRMLRFRDVIHYLKQHPDMRMTDIAYDFGYADQSHFIREFKDFTGQSPRTFFVAWQSMNELSSHRISN